MTVSSSPTLRDRLLDGETLPAAWYSDPQIFRLEQEGIFARSWHYAGPLEQAAEPGAYFTCRAGATPVVVVRGHDGELRALVNVCRHRGHEVASGCGRRETLQCPYHAWTYDLDGSLRAAPRSEREPGFDPSQFGLHTARVETWGPFVFVSPDPLAPPLHDVLGDLPRQLADRGAIEPTELVYRGRSREQVLEANWKVVVENFLECYHCPTAHKSFSRLIDVDADAYKLETTRWTSSQYGPARSGDNLPYDPGGAGRGSQFHFIFPSWTLNVLPGPPHLRVIVFQPLDADRTASYVDGFWAPDVPDSFIQELDAFGVEVGREDRDLVESVHRGLRSGAVGHGRLLVESEALIQHFQLLVHDALDAASDS
jgi:phenylpropionate dioxygenase-like ring-hydroxylating dioxygenase large terminal subunit